MKPTLSFVLLVFLLTSCFQSKQHSIAPAFKPEAKAVIKVVGQNLTDTANIYFQAYKILPVGVEKPDKISVWGNATAYLHYSIDRPAKADLAIGDSIMNFFTAPGDTATVFLSFNSLQQPILAFEGATAPINHYYQQKGLKLGYHNLNRQFETLRHDNMDMRKFRRGIQKISKREKRFLETYSSKHRLPGWFIAYEQAEIDYLTAGYLLLVPKYYQTFNIPIGPLPDSYYQFLQEIKVQRPEALLSEKYFFFLDQYFAISQNRSRFEGLAGYQQLLEIHRQKIAKANEHLHGRVKEIYLAHLLSGLLPKLPPGYPLDSLLKVYQLENSTLLNFQQLLAPASATAVKKLAVGDTVPTFYAVNEKDSLLELRQFSDKVIYINLWATWCKPCLASIPEKHKLLNRMKEQKDFLLINLCIDSKKDTWKEVISQYNLQGLNLYAEGNWSKRLKETYQAQGVPHYLLLSKGNTLAENHTNGPAGIDALILQHLEKPAKFLTQNQP